MLTSNHIFRYLKNLRDDSLGGWDFMNTKNLFYTAAILIGLGLFLLGIKIMSSSFKKDLKSTIKARINIISSNKFIGVIIGVIMTGLLQSSSATTLIIVSLVHGNAVSLRNAVPIIMGANIGTTLTAQLIAFGLGNSTLNIALLALLMYLFFRKSNHTLFPNLLLGFSLMLLGLNIISIFVNKLEAIGLIKDLAANTSDNPIIGVFLGVLITSIIQSSSTGIAILQVLASTNVITVWSTIPIILGQNIGTCTNTIIGSLATNKAGKQVAIIHVLFNVLGVLMFLFLMKPLYFSAIQLAPNSSARQIAHAHTIFNVVTTISLLPLSHILVKISKKIIRD